MQGKCAGDVGEEEFLEKEKWQPTAGFFLGNLARQKTGGLQCMKDCSSQAS